MRFNSVVFSGGGCRCVWQAGFWQVAAAALDLEQAVIGSVSAGAAMACLARAGRIQQGLAAFKRRFCANRRNFYPAHWAGERPVFPHYGIFREGLLSVLDEEAMHRLKASPDIRVLLALPPAGLPGQLAAALGIGAYILERHLLKPMHPSWSRRLGFRPLTLSVQSCLDYRQVADLVLQSSCTPPFVPLQYRSRQPVLDGGLIDNCPIATVADVQGPSLVLLSRRYRQTRFPNVSGRLYLQPSQAPPIGRWDYTNSKGLQATFDLGCRDAETFLARIGPTASGPAKTVQSGERESGAAPKKSAQKGRAAPP